MLLAEATNNDVITWGIVLVLTTIAANVAVIVGTRRKQKREVNFAFEPASKEEFERHVADNKREHENIFSKLGGVDRGASANVVAIRSEMHAMELRINNANEERTTKVHDRINDVLEAVSELRGEIKTKP